MVVIGSGFGGQAAATTLLRQGVEDLVILERRDFLGGTWCQNSYPGAAVDVQSPLYSLSFEPYPWTQMFAGQAELEEYTNHVLDKHGLRERTRLGAEVTGLRWTGDEWEVSTAAAGTFHAQFVVNASGPLSTPVVPPFPGRDTFAGAQFHTNDWDHSVDVTGKRVAIVGSGASAAQVIPAITADVGELHVFQRSPHWVMPRPDRVFTPLQRRLMRSPWVHKAVRTAIYWSLETRIVGFKYSHRALDLLAARRARKLLAEQVPDPQLRATLTPDYTIGCKRIILSNTLYPALSEPHVTVHDKGSSIAEVTPEGITTTDGQQLDLDLIVWSTGYDATDGVIPYPVTGRDGVTLADRWSEYPRAYLGTTVPGFPNLFLVTGPNTGIGHTSAIFVIEAQMEYIARAVARVRQSGAATIEVSEAAEQAYTTDIHAEMERTVWKSGGCTSWYQSRDGHVVAMFPGFSFTFRRKAKNFTPEHHLVS
ncbi:NAD(P)/FAD-dependent oxidoreductase [Rhodococcus aerolatus]